MDIQEDGGQTPAYDQVLEFFTGPADAGTTCSILTPMVNARLRQMQSRQVLELRVDDPMAKDDIGSWSRLSGNALVKVIEDEGPVIRFFIRKK